MYTVTEIDYAGWTVHLDRVEHVNLLQSWQYGAAKEQSDKWRAVRFLVRDGEGHPIALAQFLARTLPIIGGAGRMNRGPLLIGSFELDEREAVALKVVAALVRECRRRRWWVIQIAPEVRENETAARALEALGLRRLPAAPWASGELSLAPDEDALLMALNGKWRNCLRKGIKLDVSVDSFEGRSAELDALLLRYRQMQEDKGFGGIPQELITALAGQTGAATGFTLFVANEAGNSGIDRSIGMLVSVRHGDTSTYLIGTTNDVGRTLQANYVLLWRAMLHAKRAGCRWFDIGGLNSTTPPGIAHFKQGVNAVPYALTGEWRRVSRPWKRRELRERP